MNEKNILLSGVGHLNIWFGRNHKSVITLCVISVRFTLHFRHYSIFYAATSNILYRTATPGQFLEVNIVLNHLFKSQSLDFILHNSTKTCWPNTLRQLIPSKLFTGLDYLASIVIQTCISIAKPQQKVSQRDAFPLFSMRDKPATDHEGFGSYNALSVPGIASGSHSVIS